MGLVDVLSGSLLSPTVKTAIVENVEAQNKMLKKLIIGLIVVCAVGLFFFLKRRR